MQTEQGVRLGVFLGRLAIARRDQTTSRPFASYHLRGGSSNVDHLCVCDLRHVLRGSSSALVRGSLVKIGINIRSGEALSH